MDNSYLLVEGADVLSLTDAKEAGAAFFDADSTERPYVIHQMEGNAARIMADTDIVGTNADGSRRFVKHLPNSHNVDIDFRAGYEEARRIGELTIKMDASGANATRPASEGFEP